MDKPPRNRRLQSAGGDAPRVPEPLRAAAPADDAREGGPTPSLEEMEQRHILAVLEKNHGNRTATAAELGISLSKLYYRLGQYQKQGLIP